MAGTGEYRLNRNPRFFLSQRRLARTTWPSIISTGLLARFESDLSSRALRLHRRNAPSEWTRLLDTGQNDISKMSRVFLPLVAPMVGKKKKKKEKIETARYVTGPPAGLGKINGRFPEFHTIPTPAGISPKRKDARRENVVSDSAFRPG